MFKSKQENGRRQKNGILRVLEGECLKLEVLRVLSRDEKNLQSTFEAGQDLLWEKVMKSCSLWTCFPLPTVTKHHQLFILNFFYH